MESTVLEVKRICYACGSDKSNYAKGRNGKPYQKWFLNKPTTLVICSLCYANIFIQQKLLQKYYRKRRITFRGKRIYLSHHARTGICSICHKSVDNGEIRKTHSHHWVYIIIFPWFGREERCISCHSKESWKLKQITEEILNKNGEIKRNRLGQYIPRSL